jgi:hypothetical protein
LPKRTISLSDPVRIAGSSAALSPRALARTTTATIGADYDPGAAALLRQRALDLLARVG